MDGSCAGEIVGVPEQLVEEDVEIRLVEIRIRRHEAHDLPPRDHPVADLRRAARSQALAQDVARHGFDLEADIETLGLHDEIELRAPQDGVPRIKRQGALPLEALRPTLVSSEKRSRVATTATARDSTSARSSVSSSSAARSVMARTWRAGISTSSPARTDFGPSRTPSSQSLVTNPSKPHSSRSTACSSRHDSLALRGGRQGALPVVIASTREGVAGIRD